MAKRKGTCWMCGAVGPLTEEHAFPDWVRRIFASDGNDIDLSDRREGVTQRERMWTNQSGEVTVRTVCRCCNNGWMSALESRCQPFLEGLILGRRTKLAPGQLAELATWAVKTAWVFQSQTPLSSTAAAGDRKMLATPPHSIPVNVAVALGAFREPADRVMCAAWYTAGSSTGESGPIDCSRSTLVVGRVVLVVEQVPDVSHGGAVAPEWVPLIPTPTTPKAWPPDKILQIHDLEAVAHRGFGAAPWSPFPEILNPGVD